MLMGIYFTTNTTALKRTECLNVMVRLEILILAFWDTELEPRAMTTTTQVDVKRLNLITSALKIVYVRRVREDDPGTA